MTFVYEGISLIAVIIGISELMKLLGFNVKFIPVVNVVTGMIGGVVYLNPNNIKLGVLQGLVMALTASGVYSSSKSVIEGIKE